MLHSIPHSVSIGFILTTLITVFLFYKAIKKSNGFSQYALPISIGLVGLMLVHGLLAFNLFYATNIDGVPPRFALTFGPALLLFLVLFFWKKGRAFMDSLPLYDLVLISIVRIPVELVLYALFLEKMVPESMTFSGHNFDILSGISAVLILAFAFKNRIPNRKILLGWNIIALLLLLIIITTALLSAPLAFQQFAFDQPNIAVAYFPFIWLPAIVVPIVLFTHLVMIRRLLKA